MDVVFLLLFADSEDKMEQKLFPAQTMSAVSNVQRGAILPSALAPVLQQAMKTADVKMCIVLVMARHYS